MKVTFLLSLSFLAMGFILLAASKHWKNDDVVLSRLTFLLGVVTSFLGVAIAVMGMIFHFS